MSIFFLQESSGQPNKIQITNKVASKLHSKAYEIIPRGFVAVKVCTLELTFSLKKTSSKISLLKRICFNREKVRCKHIGWKRDHTREAMRTIYFLMMMMKMTNKAFYLNVSDKLELDGKIIFDVVE